jgi:hypothetical protein
MRSLALTMSPRSTRIFWMMPEICGLTETSLRGTIVPLAMMVCRHECQQPLR